MDVVILTDITTGKEMSFSSLAQAARFLAHTVVARFLDIDLRFLDIDPSLVSSYHGKIWENKYMVKVDRSKLPLDELWLPQENA